MAYRLSTKEKTPHIVEFSSTEALLGSRIHPSAALQGGTQILGAVTIGEEVQVGEGVTIGDGVAIDDEADVKDDVELWPKSSVGRYTIIHNGAILATGVEVGNRSIVSPNLTIPSGTNIPPWKIVHPGKEPDTLQIKGL